MSTITKRVCLKGSGDDALLEHDASPHGPFVERLAASAARLEAARARLNSVELDAWGRHTRRTDAAGGVARALRRHVGAEMATGAWAKFYEIVAREPRLLPRDASGALRTLHLCEAPGAFVAALNHYLHAERPDLLGDDRRGWRWVASTLRPSPAGFDDRFVTATADRWDCGADGTGDLLRAQNIAHFWQLAGEGSAEPAERAASAARGFDLVTADGSVDCSADWSAQERTTAPLFVAEVLAALGALRVGGALVVKLFTFYEGRTAALLEALAAAFDELLAVKPFASKAGNGEVYVLGVGFRDDNVRPHVLRSVLERFGEQSAPDGEGGRSLSPLERAVSGTATLESVPARFLERVAAAAEYFAVQNIAAIERNLETFAEHGRARERARADAREHGEVQPPRGRKKRRRRRGPHVVHGDAAEDDADAAVERAANSAAFSTQQRAALEFIWKCGIAELPPLCRVVQQDELDGCAVLGER